MLLYQLHDLTVLCRLDGFALLHGLYCYADLPRKNQVFPLFFLNG
jgi:hypothetical protein